MIVGDCQLVAHVACKMHGFILIKGWFHHPTRQLRSVKLVAANISYQQAEVNLPEPGVEASFGPNKGFMLQAIRSVDEIEHGIKVRFNFAVWDGFEVDFTELCRDTLQLTTNGEKKLAFFEQLRAIGSPKILDVGGRARSRVDRSKDYPFAEVTVFDILPGDNVDVVGDAHELSRHFPPESFDAILSNAVFEHILMPWKVVLEMNKVLKRGGIGFVGTHQTIGMHDLPWDFWRFSDTAWDALFNKATGYEIMDRALDEPQFVIPFVYRPSQPFPERAAGYGGSWVTFRKLGEPSVSWDISREDIVETMYPSTETNHDPSVAF